MSARATVSAEFEDQLFSAIIPPEHAYRKINKLIDFVAFTKPLRRLYSPLGQHGIPVEKGVKAIRIYLRQHISNNYSSPFIATSQ